MGLYNAHQFEKQGMKVKIGFMPVSYTHLDVYKRQEQDIVLNMFKFDVPPSDPGTSLVSLSDRNLKTVYRAAVSYTHLRRLP